MQRDMRTLEKRPLPHGELLPALIALVEALAGCIAAHATDAILFATMRANRPLRPKMSLYVGKGLVFVVVVLG